MVRYAYILTFIFIGYSTVYGQKRQDIQKIDSLLHTEMREWSIEKNIQKFQFIYDESKKIGYETGQLAALSKISTIYIQNGKFDQAILYFERIEEFQIKKKENYFYKANAKLDNSCTYSRLGLYNEAQSLLEEAKIYATQISNSDYYIIMGKYHQTQAMLYLNLKKPIELILENYKSAETVYSKIGDEKIKYHKLQTVYCSITSCYLEMNKIDSAVLYLNKIKEIPIHFEEFTAQNNVQLGAYHKKINQLDSAVYYFNNAILVSSSMNEPLIIQNSYSNLYKIYEQLGDEKNALTYHNAYTEITDSLTRVEKNATYLASLLLKKDFLDKQKKQNRNFYFSLLTTLLIILFFAFTARNIYKKYLKEKQFRILRDISLLEKDQEIKKFKTQINSSFEEILELARNNHPNFLTRFRETYPDFCTAIMLKIPDLLSSELTFCAYIKLNFTTKEIANSTYVTVKAVQNRKNRLRKRLSIPSDEDIYAWMHKLDQ